MITNIEDVPIKDYFKEIETFKDYQCGDSWEIKRLKCKKCNSTHFEVLQTGSYETTGRCVNCNSYYVVHQG